MSFFNLNTLHNVLNVLIVVFGSIAAFDWTLFVTQPTAAKITAGIALAKLILNALRDGLTGMVKPQPPVGG